MQDVDLGGQRINFADYGFQLTRSWRAVKVWLSLKHMGLRLHREAVERSLALAQRAESLLRESGDFEISSPASLGIVCFRCVRQSLDESALEALNQQVLARLNATGYAFVSSTRLRGSFVLRLCILSHLTREEDVAGVVERMRELAAESVD
jgi:glutamate/tyrosine decarboxylase-like PLP-dependent enzyme